MTSFESDPNNEFEVIFTPEEGVPFYEQRARKPLEITANGKKYVFTKENCWVALYKDYPEFNHVHMTDEDGNELYFWDMPDFADFISGFKWDEFSPERTRTGSRDSMKDLCGWEAVVLLSDEPSPEMKKLYEDMQFTDLYKAAGELTVADIIEIDT